MWDDAGFDRRLIRSSTVTFVVSLSLAGLLPVPAAAHKAHRAAGADSPVVSTRDSASPAAPNDSVPGVATRAGAAAFVMPSAGDALLEHPHNRLVHFPVALAVAAVLLLAVGRRRPELDAAGRWLVWFAALGGIAAYFTGRIQEGVFEGEPKEWLVHLHGTWGLATAIALVVWALLTLWKPAREHAWLVGIVVAALVLVTGFYGGIVAHGE